ncbi:MAG: VIT1/CCC1 transporter family protein [Thermoproteus sp.]
MEANSKKNLVQLAAEFCDDEYLDHRVYAVLAGVEWNKKRREVLRRLSDVEKRHFDFWLKFAGSYKPSLKARIYPYLFAFLRLFFGATFAAKLLERGEDKAVERYKMALDLMETPDDRKTLEAIIADEMEHEKEFIGQLDEAIVKYMSALVLGMADAIIEITGTHAGALGTTSSAIITGVVGLVVGVSAAISMASASYLQTKHETGKSPTVAALVTGVGYVVAAALMSLPYFLAENIYAAFAASLAVSVVLALMFTYQGSVYADRDFRSEFVQTVGLLLGVAALAYFLGDALSAAFGIRSLIK